jgi:hypothetical protein
MMATCQAPQPSAADDQDHLPSWLNPLRRDLPWLTRVLAPFLAVTACFALWLGFQDMLWPAGISAQFVGVLFFGAGVLGLIGAVLFMVKGERCCENHALCAVAAPAAVAGLYVNLTIVWYAASYEPLKAWAFAGLGLCCLFLAVLTVPRIWGGIGRSAKGVGISLAVLATLAQFWYQSFYTPQNVQVGIDYSLALGSMIRSGGDRIVTVELTMRDASSAAALAVDSMVIVSGVSYKRLPGRTAVSAAQAQRRMTEYARALVNRSENVAEFQNPDVRYGGDERSTILALLRPINDNRILFPNATYIRDFVVVIPERDIKALDVRIVLEYARAARITLGRPYPAQPETFPSCTHDERFEWAIDESALHRFTNGSYLFYSDWCADLNRPHIDIGITSAASGPGTHVSTAAETAIKAHFGVIYSFRDETLVLP